MYNAEQAQALAAMVEENERLGLYDLEKQNNFYNPLVKQYTKEHNMTTVKLEEDENGDLIMPISQELLDKMGWKPNDQLVWKDQGNGSFSLSKKKPQTELVLVDAVSTFRIRYLVEVPVGKSDWALDTVVMGEAVEFSQKYLDEQIVSHRVITESEAIMEFNRDNDYLVHLNDSDKLDQVVTPWTEEDNSENG
ncbi:hypothetical protein UFOVP116_343 [uncultured Caudovirales phage]|uniref:Uncharacterized protein n=1 Tax=uncultured Caudovirales phage TaxID=2100421 RepID=A0A6J5LB49_9CAUD|nr:hypothetical protein UFOVP116_343 [uncultured Caudovirales phage]